ncbi:MAG: SpoIIE family protein phosphatase [Bacteroidia bacterium]|nr:SpoIIE family protein phosphatase [Bacteroidia bacterium]
MEGVSYAKRIQQAILPDYEISQYFKKYYLIFRPRYDVSGDFYWFTEQNGKFYLAVADCTGQGVSGAFMSMIGNTLLNEVINEKKIDDPSFILETINTEFKMALHQNQRLSDDSMDICLCCIEHSPDKESHWLVTFSGANRPLYYSQGWDIHEIKGTPRPIGGRLMDKDKFFETHSFELKKGNFLYLLTDGFTIQHNRDQKKFGSNRLKESLRKIIHLPVKQQEEKLTWELEEFMQDVEQKDDITLFALKL